MDFDKFEGIIYSALQTHSCLSSRRVYVFQDIVVHIFYTYCILLYKLERNFRNKEYLVPRGYTILPRSFPLRSSFKFPSFFIIWQCFIWTIVIRQIVLVWDLNGWQVVNTLKEFIRQNIVYSYHYILTYSGDLSASLHVTKR